MIVVWLRGIWRWLLVLLIPPPPGPPAIPRLDQNEACPACGNTGGSLECVHVASKVMVEHTCGTCGARWYVKPVMMASPQLVLPKQ